MAAGTHNWEYEVRKAPYAPVSALREFFERMREISVPARVDRRFLQKMNVASNNEWALLSALKFLGIVDEAGIPTTAYRRLQPTDRFQPALADLVRRAYRDLLEAGGDQMSVEDLQNYFRVASSPSQARNAARFFREVSRMAGLRAEQRSAAAVGEPVVHDVEPPREERVSPGSELLTAKASLLAKLPAPDPSWTAEQYTAICDRFLAMLAHLDGSS